VAAQQAAKLLGFKFTIANGNYNQGGAYATDVDNAIAAKANAIVLVGIDCDQVTIPLEQAIAAGIKIMGFGGVDCPGHPLFNAPMKFSASMPNTDSFNYVGGQVAAAYMIDKLKDNIKLVTMVGRSERLLQLTDQGFDSMLARCTACNPQILDKVEYNSADLVPNGPWITATRSALVKNPTANAVYMPWDVCLAELGGAQAVKEAGLQALVFGGQGNADGMNELRQGLVSAITAAYSPIWLGWGAMDNINRALNGQPTVTEGIGYTLVDMQHNLPPNGQPYQPSIKFQAAYEKSWGVSAS
jgi:ribose transport system substrate-binding protein